MDQPIDRETDVEIVSRYIQGDLSAFEHLIQRYTQVIYRFVFKIVLNREEAHDITQETIIKVWKNIKKFDLERNFKTWVFTIARTTTLDQLRKRKNSTFSSLSSPSSLNDTDNETDFEQNIPDTELLAHELFEKNETIELVQKALETISVDNKTIILLRHGEEMTFEEIAEIVEKPMNTVKSQYRRAMIVLKKYLETDSTLLRKVSNL